MSVLRGAFVLVAARVLDGLRATTHWAAALELACRYPDVRVDPGCPVLRWHRIIDVMEQAQGRQG
jgi:transcriptional regulator GlxA family with amidase domain